MNEFLLKLYSNPIFIIILIICILIIIFEKKIYMFIIGHAGEHWTKKKKKKLPKDKYTILNNILFNIDGFSCQIDHIVVSKYGIFVIESKQYHGFITGDKYDKKWIRHLSKTNKIEYENPIRQNYGHVKNVCKLLNLTDKQVFNIVCVNGECDLKIKHDGELVNSYSLNDKILSYNTEIISIPEVYVKQLLHSNKVDNESKKKHISYAQTIKNVYENKCPKCGGELITRNGKNGVFIGCSNFPKCRYTRNK